MGGEKPLESCDHLWRQTGYWDGQDKDGNRVDKDGNYLGGPSAQCDKCHETVCFQWNEWNALPEEKKTEFTSRY